MKYENSIWRKDRNRTFRILALGLIILSLFGILGCAGFRASSKSDYPGESGINGDVSAFMIEDESEFQVDTVGVSPNLIKAKYHFYLAEQAIGDNDPEQAADEFDKALNYLSIIEPGSDSTTYFHLIETSVQILESYRDFLKDIGVLSDEFVPEGVLLGEEEFYDSLGEWSDWSDFSIVGTETVSPGTETIALFPPVPLVSNKKVNQLLSYFQGRGRKVFLRWIDRGQIVLPRMQEILREEGLPEEVAYIAMIESGLNPKAYSWAHASGIWQFIRSTGRLFGLYSDWWYDERRDVEKSTHAAAAYLKKLYLEFDDWYLAFAAYNCGELRVHRAIQQHRTKDFWKLWRLPRQTENYVPTYIATAIIMKDPVQYGFPELQQVEVPTTDLVWVSGCVDLNVLADCAGIDVVSLKDMNPHILRWCTPPTVDSVALTVPAGASERFWSKYTQIPQDQKTRWIRHRVRSGETLSEIANRYGTTISAIMDVPDNNLRNVHRIPVGKDLLIPAPPGGVTTAVSQKASSYDDSGDSYEDQTQRTYRVKRGDTLGKIASQYGVSVSKLKDWNGLNNKKFIYPGQVLHVWVSESGSEPMASSANTGDPVTHTVRRGESLWSISQRYSVSISAIQGANNMGRRTKIKPGEVFVIPTQRSGG